MSRTVLDYHTYSPTMARMLDDRTPAQCLVDRRRRLRKILALAHDAGDDGLVESAQNALELEAVPVGTLYTQAVGQAAVLMEREKAGVTR